MEVVCPHCNGSVLIIELNCCILRHAVYKDSGKQLNPHASKELCDQVIKEGLVYGCAKPFKIINNQAVACDYI
jgi:hypothetical protein